MRFKTSDRRMDSLPRRPPTGQPIRLHRMTDHCRVSRQPARSVQATSAHRPTHKLRCWNHRLGRRYRINYRRQSCIKRPTASASVNCRPEQHRLSQPALERIETLAFHRHHNSGDRAFQQPTASEVATAGRQARFQEFKARRPQLRPCKAIWPRRSARIRCKSTNA